MSREAPVLILEYDSTEIVPGGAGNAANNVAALGGSAIAIGVAGEDEAGRRLLEAMRDRVDVRNVVTHRSLTHSDQDADPRRRRPLGQAAGRPHRSCRARSRFRNRYGPPWPRRAAAALGRSDALIVSDYGSGLVTPALVRAAQRTLKRSGIASAAGAGRLALCAA